LRRRSRTPPRSDDSTQSVGSLLARAITLGTAARLADVTRFEMRDILREEGVELRIGPEDMADARREIDAARDL